MEVKLYGWGWKYCLNGGCFGTLEKRVHKSKIDMGFTMKNYNGNWKTTTLCFLEKRKNYDLAVKPATYHVCDQSKNLVDRLVLSQNPKRSLKLLQKKILWSPYTWNVKSVNDDFPHVSWFWLKKLPIAVWFYLKLLKSRELGLNGNSPYRTKVKCDSVKC